MTADEKRTLKQLFGAIEVMQVGDAARGELLAVMCEKMEVTERHLGAINGRCDERGKTIGQLQVFEATTTEALKHVAPKTDTAQVEAILGTAWKLLPWALSVGLLLWSTFSK